MARLVQIGNSLGVRIPKAIIEQAGLDEHELAFHVTDGGLLLAPVRKVREGWAEAAQAAHTAGDDAALLNEAALNEFDTAEWTW